MRDKSYPWVQYNPESLPPLYNQADNDYRLRVGRIPVLPPEITSQLIRQAQHDLNSPETNDMVGNCDYQPKSLRRPSTGSLAADKLWKHNVRLIFEIAMQHALEAGPQLELGDLIQEGSTALINAIKKYNHDQGTWYGYASVAVTRGILRATMAQKETIRLPENVRAELRRLEGFYDMLFEENGSEPTISQVASVARTDQKTAETFRTYREPAASLERDYPELLDIIIIEDAELNGGHDEWPTNNQHDHKQAMGLEERIIDLDESDRLNDNSADINIEEAFAHAELTEREAQVIRMLIDFESDEDKPTIAKMAQELKLTTTRIMQLKNSALAKLRRRYYYEFRRKRCV